MATEPGSRPVFRKTFGFIGLRLARRVPGLRNLPPEVWIAITAVSVTIAFPGSLALLAALFGVSIASSNLADLNRQCNWVIGANPSESSTSTTPPPVNGIALAPSEVPTNNPYATDPADPQVISGASKYQTDCVTAMQTAKYQLPELYVTNTSIAAQRARDTALTQVGAGLAAGAGSTDGPTDDSFSPETLVTYVIHFADPTIVLPNNLAGQIGAGQPVDSTAASPGDLVFWDFHNDAPTRVGIALSNSEMVAGDQASGRFVREVIPHTTDVRVKRVLETRAGA